MERGKTTHYCTYTSEGKLTDYYMEFNEAVKTNFATLKQALQEKAAGLIKDPLVASRSFNQQSQWPDEKVNEYVNKLKHLIV